jgi:hypothetical protein
MGWFRPLLSRRCRYDELSDSIREHIAEKIEDLIDHGMTREEAERKARHEFGNVTRIEERSREVWQWPALEASRSAQRLLPGRSCRAPCRAVGSRILSSDFDSAVAADYTWSRFPNSPSTSI